MKSVWTLLSLDDIVLAFKANEDHIIRNGKKVLKYNYPSHSAQYWQKQPLEY